jgi:hypothetical protein
MRRYIVFANIALFIVCIFLGPRAYREMREVYSSKNGISHLRGDLPTKHKEQERLPAPVLAGMGHPADYYSVVHEKDLFRPERMEHEEALPSEEEESEDEAGTAKKEIRPPLIDLYGIMIEKKKKVALLYDRREINTNLRYKVAAQGDEIQGYKLVLIQPEQIVFEKSGQKATIGLSQKKPARGGIMAVAKEAPKVAKQEKGKASPTAVSVEKKAVVKAPPGKGKASSLAVSVEKETTVKKPSATGSSKGKSDEEGEYRIINTPFGKLKKRIKK